MGRAGLDTLGARLQHLEQVGLGEGPLGLADPRSHAVPGHRAAHEDHEALLGATDAGAPVGQRVDVELQLGFAAGAADRGAGGGGAGGSGAGRRAHPSTLAGRTGGERLSAEAGSSENQSVGPLTVRRSERGKASSRL